MKLLKLNLICIINCTTSKKRTAIWTIDFFLNLKNLSSAGKKTARFLLAKACDSYVPYVRCAGWKPRYTEDALPDSLKSSTQSLSLSTFWTPSLTFLLFVLLAHQTRSRLSTANEQYTGHWLKPHSARTGRTVFSQLSAAVVRHKANDGVVYTIRAWFKCDTVLSAVV